MGGDPAAAAHAGDLGPRHVRAGAGRPGEQRGNRRRPGGAAGRSCTRSIRTREGTSARRVTCSLHERADRARHRAAAEQEHDRLPRRRRQAGTTELDEAVRKYLAWKDIAGTEDRIPELDLPPQQAAQAHKRLKDADETVDLRISAAYHWLLVPVQPTGRPPGILTRSRPTRPKTGWPNGPVDKLRAADMLRIVQGPQNIRLNLDQFLSIVWSAGHIAVGKLWEYYCQYAYLPRLAERSVLDRGILAVFDQMVWDQDGFAVASGYDEASGQVRRAGDPQENVPPQITDTTLLVRPGPRDRPAGAGASRAGSRPRCGRSCGGGRYRRHGAVSGTGTDVGATAGPVRAAPFRRRIVRRTSISPGRLLPRALRAGAPPLSARPQEHPLLRHGPPRPGALRP